MGVEAAGVGEHPCPGAADPFRLGADDGLGPSERRPVGADAEDGDHLGVDRAGLGGQALRAGATPDQVHQATKIDPWFIDQLVLLLEIATMIESAPELNADLLRTAKRHGFSDAQIAGLRHLSEEDAFDTLEAALGVRLFDRLSQGFLTTAFPKDKIAIGVVHLVLIGLVVKGFIAGKQAARRGRAGHRLRRCRCV